MAVSQSRAAPRPISAWLLLIVIALFGLLWTSVTVRGIFRATSGLNQISNLWLWVAIWAVVAIPVAGVFLASVVGIYQRKQWGRWLGLLMLVGFAAFCIFKQDTTVYTNEMEQAGGHFARKIFMPLLLAWWAYAFGFSAKAKRYFARPSNVV
jgi:hypothetical protein